MTVDIQRELFLATVAFVVVTLFNYFAVDLLEYLMSRYYGSKVVRHDKKRR